MTFETLERKLLEWQRKTALELMSTLETAAMDPIQKEDIRQLEQELWLIECLRRCIFFPRYRPRPEGVVSKLFMNMVMNELAGEFIRQERYGLCFILKTRQSSLIDMCTEDDIVFRMAS